MKQLYASGPLTARAGTSATVRASSAGLKPDELRDALPATGYAPPPARAEHAERPLPVRLALLHAGSSGRVLTHVTPNGETYFAHSLLNVPATADAQLAIQTWGSPQWQRREPDAGTDLPELPYLPVADVLDDASLRRWLAAPIHREMLEFVLTALLGSPSTTRIFLAAPADDVAAVVYAVTRVLPPDLLDDFTFSTYEADPLACSARVIGHEAGTADWDLPAACYQGAGVGFNPGTRERSDLSVEVPFARFAVDALTADSTAPLDDVKAAWQRLGLKELRQFDLVYRLTRGTGTLTQDEATAALNHPPLAAWIATRSDALNQLLDWALADRQFATGPFARAVQTLRQKPDTLAKLGQTVRDRGLAAVRTGDRDTAAIAFEVILPMVAPAKANGIWGELLITLADPAAVAWDVRTYLLPRFVRFKQQQGITALDVAMAAWLAVPTEKLGDLLAIDLPRSHHLAAARACLARTGEPSELLVRTLAGHSGLALSLLQPGDADRSVSLFTALLAHAPRQPWFEDVLAKATDYPADLLNRFFEATLAGGTIDAERLVRGQGVRLLELFAGRSGLDRVGSQLLANPPADLLGNRELLSFLGKLRGAEGISTGLTERIAAVEAIRSYLDAPTFEPAAMTAAADGLAVTPPVVPLTAKSDLFAAVANLLQKRANDESLPTDLEAVLVHFGAALATDPADLFENLLRDLRGRSDFAKHPNLVPTFLGLALGAAKSPELHGKLDGLDGHAFALAADAATRGGNRLLEMVAARSETWPKAARTQWNFLQAAVRPRGTRGLLRDAGLVLLGGIVATAVCLAVRFLG